MKYILILPLLILTACSSNLKNRNALIASSFVVGSGIGYGTAPTGERKELHSVYWGAVLGTVAAIAGNYLYNDEKDLELQKSENQKLKAEIELMQNANKVLIDQGSGKFKNPSGESYFQGQRAKWRIYQIDRWTKDGPSRLYHQDKMVELVPENEN